MLTFSLSLTMSALAGSSISALYKPGLLEVKGLGTDLGLALEDGYLLLIGSCNERGHIRVRGVTYG